MVGHFGRSLLLLILVLAGQFVQAERPIPPQLHLPTTLATSDKYAFEIPFPDLPKVSMVGFTCPPEDTNRLFLIEKTGIIWVITNLARPNLTIFLDLSAKTFSEIECGLTGMAFHPQYSSNGKFYVFYSTQATTALGTGLHQRIAQFVVDPNNPDRAIPDSEIPMITQYDRDPEHQGGTLQFGPDGYLYIGLGDEGGSFDSFGNSQRIDGNFFSALLRIDVDMLSQNLPPNPHPAVNPGTYLVPADNPFLGLSSFGGRSIEPLNVRTEFYAIGFRNPFRFSFDPLTRELYVNDVGQNRREEINRVQPGGNYGWSYFEGTIENPLNPGVDPRAFQAPIYEYEHDGLHIAITAGLPYRGNKFPELYGTYLFFDFAGSLGMLQRDPIAGWINRWLPGSLTPSGVTDLMVQPGTGDILLADFYFGVIARMIRQPSGGGTLPSRLSDTGIFSDMASLKTVPGIEPYEVNVPFWSDGAIKRRWFMLPTADSHLVYTNVGAWKAPPGTVWVKHFDLPVVSNATVAPRRIETRLLVRTETGVYGASYRWRDDQTEADLVSEAGTNSTFQVLQNGTNHTQTWHFPALSECATCHNPQAGYSLSFNTAQLNHPVTRNGTTINQISALSEAGYFTEPPVAPEYSRRLASLDDTTTSRRWLARSFLAANCTACHFPSGPTRATWDARPEPDLSDAGIVGAVALNNVSDPFTSVSNYIVLPGDLSISTLYRRLADDAPYHMPPLATTELNTSVLPLMAGWITNDLVLHSNYLQWTGQHFPPGSPTSVTDGASDPDGDGLVNEAEWLLSENPVDAHRNWKWSITLESDGAHLRYTRLADVAFQVEVSPSMSVKSSWRVLPVPGNEWHVTAMDTPVDLLLPPADFSNTYYRVKISEP